MFLYRSSEHGSHGRDVTKRAQIDVHSLVSGQNYDILTSIIAKLLMSQPFGDLSHEHAGTILP